MRKVGITGANGFVGKNLAAHLDKNGFSVVPFKGCVTKIQDFESLNQCQDVIHLAGINRGTDSQILHTNVQGTFNAVQYCLSNKSRLLVAGSIKTTGMYGASKGICEEMIRLLRHTGLNGAYLALAGIYGPHAKPFYNSFPTTLMHCIAQNKDYEPLVSSWHSQMRLIHVSDVCNNVENILRRDFLYDEEYGPKSHCMEFWHAGEFNISIEDFIQVVKNRKPSGHVSERNIHLIRQTADWYKDHETEAHGR